MLMVFRRWCVPALCLAFGAGCSQGTDDEFHTFTVPAPSVTTPANVTSPVKSPSGVVAASAQVPQPPTPSDPVPARPPEPAVAEVPPLAPSAAEALASLSPLDPTKLPPSELQLLIPEKTFKTEGPDGAIRVSFDDIDLLKVLNVNPVPLDIEHHLPAWLSGLNGKRVVIRGWMYPPDQETELSHFIFVKDNQICCFGRTAMIYDKFRVRLREGVTTDYILGRPFDLVGEMTVKSRIVNGELFWLYMLNDAVVIDK